LSAVPATASRISSIWTEAVSSREARPSVSDTGSFDAVATHRRWREREAEIRASALLTDDWDGEGAHAPAPGVVDTAVQLISLRWNEGRLPPPARVTISSDGTIIISWRGAGTYLEAEIEEPGRVQWMLKTGSQKAQHWHEGIGPARSGTSVRGWDAEEKDWGTNWSQSGRSTARA
jgi:hypothetical protein